MARTALRLILVVAPVVWIGALVAAAFLASRPAPGIAAYGLSAAIYEIGSLVCHQLPERSFHLWGAQLAVCARCAGLYVGAAASAAGVGLFRPPIVEWGRAARARLLLMLAALPTAITLLYEWTSGDMPRHAIRAAAGFPLGAIVMLIVLAAATSPTAVEIH